MRTKTSPNGYLWQIEEEGVWVHQRNGRTVYSIAKRHGKRWVVYEGYLRTEVESYPSLGEAIRELDNYYGIGAE